MKMVMLAEFIVLLEVIIVMELLTPIECVQWLSSIRIDNTICGMNERL